MSHCTMAGLPFATAVQEPPEDVGAPGDLWVQRLDDERTENRLMDPELWGFSDGSLHQRRGSVGAGTIYLKPASTADGAWDLGRHGSSAGWHSLPMPQAIGAKTTSIYDAEANGVLDIMCSQPPVAVAPAVTDSQNVVDLLRRGLHPRGREGLRGKNIPLQRRIRRKGTQLAHHGGVPGAAWASNYQDSGLQAGSTSLGSRDLLKVKAHQAEDEEGEPN